MEGYTEKRASSELEAESEALATSLKGWVFVVNPASGSGSTGKKFPKMLERFKAAAASKSWRDIDDVKAVMTTAPNDGTRLTRQALLEGASVVVAVGGDGSLAEVVEGFFEPGESHAKVSETAVLAFVPNGTGGDFRKTLGWSKKYEDALENLLKGTTKKVDVGYVRMDQGTPTEAGRHFINISSCGSSALIAQIANSSPNILGSTFTFYSASVRGLLQYQPRTLCIKVDGGDWQEIKDVNCLAVCNGGFFGSGMKVAPTADISDALFDVTIWAGFGVLDFVLLSPLIYSGEHLKHEKTTSFRCTSLEVRAAGEGTSDGSGGDPIAVELDGETPGALPASFRLLPSALRLVA